MSRKTQRVVLNSQAREIISKIYDFMKKEAINNYAEKLTDARWRTAQAAGVSESTVSRILRERRENTYTTMQSTVPAVESIEIMDPIETDVNVPSTERTTDPIMVMDIESENEESMSLLVPRTSCITSPKRKARPRYKRKKDAIDTKDAKTRKQSNN